MNNMESIGANWVKKGYIMGQWFKKMIFIGLSLFTMIFFFRYCLCKLILHLQKQHFVSFAACLSTSVLSASSFPPRSRNVSGLVSVHIKKESFNHWKRLKNVVSWPFSLVQKPEIWCGTFILGHSKKLALGLFLSPYIFHCGHVCSALFPECIKAG